VIPKGIVISYVDDFVVTVSSSSHRRNVQLLQGHFRSLCRIAAPRGLTFSVPKTELIHWCAPSPSGRLALFEGRRPVGRPVLLPQGGGKVAMILVNPLPLSDYSLQQEAVPRPGRPRHDPEALSPRKRPSTLSLPYASLLPPRPCSSVQCGPLHTPSKDAGPVRRFLASRPEVGN